MKTPLLAVVPILAALLAAPAVAQDGEGERLLRAIFLPRTTTEARQAGIAEEELRKALFAGRERRVPPDEMDVVLEEEIRALKEHGPIGNFGAFVQQRLDEGLRGRELAAAIRAEHAARKQAGDAGKAKGKGKAKGDH